MAGPLPSSEHQFRLLSQIGAVLREFPELKFWEALSMGQIESKKWLIRELEKIDQPLGTVFILGGWWGILPAMMFESQLRISKIRSFDIDPACANVADTINRPYVVDGWRFKASTFDMMKIDLDRFTYSTLRANGSNAELNDAPDTIINTSCEHISSFPIWWERVPAGKLIVLQSNNFFAAKDHCNSVSSIEEFQLQYRPNSQLTEKRSRYNKERCPTFNILSKGTDEKS